MVTTWHQKWPNMGQNSMMNSFFARRAIKASAKGQSPPQEIEVGRRSGPYLLVLGNVEQMLHHQLTKTVKSTVPSKSNWQICKPVKLRAGGKELHWQAYLSVGFARHSWLQVFVSWRWDVRHSTWLEGNPTADDWIIWAGQLTREITTNNVE